MKSWEGAIDEREPVSTDVFERNGHYRSGYLGRLGIFENLLVTDAIRPLIVARESANVIKQKGLQQGMQTLRDDGWVKVRNGTTTIAEVLRVTEEEET